MMLFLQLSRLSSLFHQTIRGHVISFKPARDDTVQRPLASADHDQSRAHGDDQQMIFESLSLLLPEPVHEKSLRPMYGRNRADHDDDETRSRESSEESGDQPQTAERFSDNDEKGHEPGQPHLLGKEPHRSFEAVTTEPAQQFLSTVRE